MDSQQIEKDVKLYGMAVYIDVCGKRTRIDPTNLVIVNGKDELMEQLKDTVKKVHHFQEKIFTPEKMPMGKMWLQGKDIGNINEMFIAVSKSNAMIGELDVG